MAGDRKTSPPGFPVHPCKAGRSCRRLRGQRFWRRRTTSLRQIERSGFDETHQHVTKSAIEQALPHHRMYSQRFARLQCLSGSCGCFLRFHADERHGSAPEVCRKMRDILAPFGRQSGGLSCSQVFFDGADSRAPVPIEWFPVRFFPKKAVGNKNATSRAQKFRGALEPRSAGEAGRTVDCDDRIEPVSARHFEGVT
jgi:hypothetical protein